MNFLEHIRDILFFCLWTLKKDYGNDSNNSKTAKEFLLGYNRPKLSKQIQPHKPNWPPKLSVSFIHQENTPDY